MQNLLPAVDAGVDPSRQTHIADRILWFISECSGEIGEIL
jgi:hypothetical protein